MSARSFKRANSAIVTASDTLSEVSQINEKLVEGQALMADSIPVVVASDQSAIPVTASGGGALATEATLALVQTDTGVIAGDTTSLDTKIPAQGQALMASSMPVAIASDQSAIQVLASGGGALATEATLALVQTDTGVIAGDTTSLDTKIPSQGQALMASSVPVAIASDQSAIQVLASGGGALATEATLALVQTDTGVIAADTTSLDTKIPAQGQALMASSMPVAIASDQSAIEVIAAGGGALATEATLALVQTDTGVIAGDTTSLDTKIPSQGQALMASSVPVVIASDQSEVLTNTLAASRKSVAAIQGTSVAADTYYLLVDLDNTGGQWPHQQNTSIDIDHITASVNFATGSAECVLSIGVITRVDGTDADLTYLWSRRIGAQNAQEGVVVSDNFQPSSLTFHQDSGSLIGAISSVKEAGVAAINTVSTLNSPAGSVTPGLGDIILKADYVADTFSFDLTTIYHSD